MVSNQNLGTAVCRLDHPYRYHPVQSAAGLLHYFYHGRHSGHHYAVTRGCRCRRSAFCFWFTGDFWRNVGLIKVIDELEISCRLTDMVHKP